MFFAPLAVTGVVIVGALAFVWASDPEPAERPEVERVDLSEREPAPESPRLSSVPTTRQFEGEEASRPARATAAGRVFSASPSDVAPVAEVEDDYDDDEDIVDMTSDREYTPEERREAKAGLVGAVRKVPFMAPMMKHLEPKEAVPEGAAQEGTPANQEVAVEPAQSGAAGAAAQ